MHFAAVQGQDHHGSACCASVLQRASLNRRGDDQLDCGIHPAYSGMAGLPFFDVVDPATIDLLLVTQCVPSRVADSAIASALAAPVRAIPPTKAVCTVFTWTTRPACRTS